jgi:hypothetical protein
MNLTPTGARELAGRLALVQPEHALVVAKAIDAPWFRCQALSYVARYWPNDDYAPILKDALRAADSQDQVYNRIAVSAWPIRAYLERGKSLPAQELLLQYRQASGDIENMGSRSEAIFALFQAARPFDSDLWQPVYWALVEAAEPALSWRQLRNLKDAAAMVVSSHPALVHQALEKLSEPKNLAAIRRCLDAPSVVEPRPYFWVHGH